MNRRTTLALTAVAAPALALGLAASTASAAPEADPVTVRGVTAAVTTSPATAAVPADGYAVTDVRVVRDATGDVAAATLEPADPAALDPATAVLRLDGGTWTVVDLGTAGVGCDLLTPAQRAGLALTC